MKMIIDTDPGVDDALAIALACVMDEIELIGLTTVFGNTYVEQSARNARYMLDMLTHKAPVAKGAAFALARDSHDPSDYVHGPEGFGALTDIPQIGLDDPRSAAQFLVDAAAEHKGELVICPIGPLTNIALALELDPNFAANVKDVILMGGAYQHAGNITPHAEANIYNDAAAADAVFASDLNVTMVGLDATMQTLLTWDDFVQMGEDAPRVGGFIRDISYFYLRFYRSIGIEGGCAMHDSMAVLVAAFPERFTFEDSGLQVILEGDELGRTCADPSRKKTRIAMGVDTSWAVPYVKSEIARLS
jgi:inosine-uridine nucleoside N-ribohydrolase